MVLMFSFIFSVIAIQLLFYVGDDVLCLFLFLCVVTVLVCYKMFWKRDVFVGVFLQFFVYHGILLVSVDIYIHSW